MKKTNYLFVIVLMLMLSCSSTPDKVTVENRLRNMQELGTTEYVLSKIIVAEDKQWYAVGEKQVIISMKASLKAGIDMSKIKVVDVNRLSNTIVLDLPKSKIILLDINPEDIKYEFVNVAFSRYNFTNEELNEIEVLGEKNIRQKIAELNILTDADNNAKNFLLNWLKSIGFKQIKFTENE